MPKKAKTITDGSSSGDTPSSSPTSKGLLDMEDSFGGGGKGPGRPIVHSSRRRRGGRRAQEGLDENDDVEIMDIDDEENSSPTATPAESKTKEEKVVLANDKESFDKWHSEGRSSGVLLERSANASETWPPTVETIPDPVLSARQVAPTPRGPVAPLAICNLTSAMLLRPFRAASGKFLRSERCPRQRANRPRPRPTASSYFG